MYLSQARTVISSAPELVESVLNGARPLNDATLTRHGVG